MSSQSLHISDDGTLHMLGVLGFANVEAIYKAGKKWIAKANRTLLLVDLEKLTRCDSAGLAMLVAWIKEANHHGKIIQYIKLPQQIINMIDLIGLHKIL